MVFKKKTRQRGSKLKFFSRNALQRVYERWQRLDLITYWGRLTHKLTSKVRDVSEKIKITPRQIKGDNFKNENF